MEKVLSTPRSEPSPPAREELSAGARRMSKFVITMLGHLIRVENEEIIKTANDPIIFAFNHNSSYETLLVPAYLMYIRQGKKVSFIIDWMYGRIPIVKWLFSQIEPIYVYNKPARLKFMNKNRPRKNKEKQSVYSECIRYLHLNKSIGIFPEGKRNRNPDELIRGRTGIGRIILESNVPVLPIGIDFPARIKKNRIPKFGSLILRVGEILEFPVERGMMCEFTQKKDIDPRCCQKVMSFLSAKITYTVMCELSGLSGKRYPFPPPVQPGEIKL